MTVLLAQISDLHPDGSDRATRRATRVMDHLRALPRPTDALLVTGDIADHGAEAEYEEAARILAAPFPVLMCPGNHDVRPAYRKVPLAETPDDGPVDQVHHVAGTAVLMCDSTVPGRDEGHLDEQTLTWIDTTLAGLPRETPAAGRTPPPAARLRRARSTPAGRRRPHRTRPHRGGLDIRRTPSDRGAGDHLDAAYALGGRPRRGPRPTARSRLPHPGRRRSTDHPLPRRALIQPADNARHDRLPFGV